MDYAHLKDEIKEIAEIANSVPEQFKNKCFEILLSELLSQTRRSSRSDTRKEQPEAAEAEGRETERKPSGGSAIPMTTQVRVLTRKTGLPEEEIAKILFVENGDVHFVKEPHDVPVATGQIEWALLLALKNAILNDALTCDPEAVRSMCKEKGFYDGVNFATTFKVPKNAKLFKGPMVAQGEAQALTSDGQDALAKLVKKLAGDGQ